MTVRQSGELPRGPILVLAALKEELAPLKESLTSPGIRLFKTGVGPRRAQETARAHMAGARLVVSTGCCGGLAAGASRGLMVVPRSLLLLEDGEVKPAPDPDLQWGREALMLADKMGLHCTDRPLLTVPRALTTPESKKRWHQQCGAVAVDMETAAVARVAAEAGVPHLALRVVLDSEEDTIAEEALSDPDGKIKPVRLARAMLKPRQFLSRAAMQVHLRTISRSSARLLRVLLVE